MIAGLLIPALALVALTIAVVRGVERCVPESIPGLAALAAISALLIWGLSAVLFATLYAAQLASITALAGTGGWQHFLKLGAQAALIWGPIVLLVVSTAPRRWTTAEW